MSALLELSLDELKQRLGAETTPTARAALEVEVGRRHVRAGAHDQALRHFTSAHAVYEEHGDRRAAEHPR